MAALENSSVPLKPVKRVQFGILSPEEIVSVDSFLTYVWSTLAENDTT